MEKDYFQDRSPEAGRFNAIQVGDMVYICEKHMQRTATKREDLTKGKVTKKLTKHDHPRGIKVSICCQDGRTAIGRVIYKG